MSPATIIAIGAASSASYFLASAFIGAGSRDDRADRIRDVTTTVILFTVYTIVAVSLVTGIPGPITMVAAIALLAAVVWFYTYYRDKRGHGTGARPSGNAK